MSNGIGGRCARRASRATHKRHNDSRRHRFNLGIDCALHLRIDGDIGPTSPTAGKVFPICSRGEINRPKINPGLICALVLVNLPIDISDKKSGLDIVGRASWGQVVVVNIKPGAWIGGGDFAPAHIRARRDRYGGRS